MFKRQLNKFQHSTSLLQKQVRQVGECVMQEGDQALFAYTQKWDGVLLKSLRVKKVDLDAASKQVPQDLKKAILHAKDNIEKYHRHQTIYLKQQPVETTKGITCYRKFSPIQRIGVYIPSGSAPLFSSVLMTLVPARIAGCTEIVLCSPPQKDGKIAPSIAFAAQLCGATEIYAIGGAQAIFAMAYGTKTIKPVMKIMGPGNDFVNEAKKQISTFLPIDMPAGPSEVMVIADKTQKPEIICMDLLAQLEHGPSSVALCIALDKQTLMDVQKLLPQYIQQSKRKTILQESIKNLDTYLAKDAAHAMQIANDYAPEHLIIATRNASALASKAVNAGSVFIGKYSAESIGDYASGTNHTLPTQGYAKNYSGLSVESFGKWTSFQKISKEGFKRIAHTVKIMSEHESLYEHQNAILLREKLL